MTFELLWRLTDLLLRWSYEGTTSAEAIVRRVARRYAQPVDVTFLPDTAILSVGGHTAARTGTSVVPPLHQVSAFKRLLATIDGGGLTAEQAGRGLAALERLPAPFGRPLRVLGMALFSVGFGISVQATWQEVYASALLGLCVGLLVQAAERRPRLVLVLPFLTSVVVSALVLVAFEQHWISGGPIQLMVPALFFFIPGDTLSGAMLELAAGRVTAGAARLVYSLAVLLMLGFGAVVATLLVGTPTTALFDADVPGNLGQVAVWTGWLLFGVGVMFVFGMAPADFPWALGVIVLTAGTAALADAAFGEPVSTFTGALVMTITALALGRRPSLPPPYVLYLGAFYALTPGSHGLRGIESWTGGDRLQGVTSLASMVGLVTALAVGMLVGATVVRTAATG